LEKKEFSKIKDLSKVFNQT